MHVVDFNVFEDSRGRFQEWFRREDFSKETNFSFDVQQANFSKSKKGVIRGIHYSLSSLGQSKWVTCLFGKVLDVVVDIRPNSPTYGKYVKVELDAETGRCLHIDGNLGHSFLSLEDNSVVAYLLSSTYAPDLEHGVNPLDPDIKINWEEYLPIGTPLIISEKDRDAASLESMRALGKLPMLG